MPEKPAQTDAPILDIIRKRWSPVIFSDARVEDEKVASLFEAARWACSSYNEQPWRFIYAQKDDPGRDTLESLLVEGNAWAKSAGLLMISFYKKTHAKNGKENPVALHDVGAANFAISLQATAMGLWAHQMVGFARDTAAETLGLSSDFGPASMMAIGYAGVAANAPADLQKREEGQRTRNPVETFAFIGRYPS